MTAAINDCHKVIPYLIKASANINLRNNNGDSALMIAAKEGNYYAFKALIEAGAETDIKNNDGDSVFEIAEKKRKKTIHNYLKKNFDKKEIIQTGGAPLSENAKKVFDYLQNMLYKDKNDDENSKNQIIQLIQNNSSIATEVDGKNNTMLYYAIFGNAPPRITIAILNANPEQAKIKTIGGRLPLQMAINEDNDISVINALINAFPEAVNMPDKSGLTTLLYAEKKKEKEPEYYKELISAIEAGQKYCLAVVQQQH